MINCYLTINHYSFIYFLNFEALKAFELPKLSNNQFHSFLVQFYKESILLNPNLNQE